MPKKKTAQTPAKKKKLGKRSLKKIHGGVWDDTDIVHVIRQPARQTPRSP